MRDFIKGIGFACGLAGITMAITLGTYAMAQRVQRPTSKPLTLESAKLQGRVVTGRSTELRKFNKPVPKPAHVHPEERRGGSWHWHQRYGWIWFPVAVAPKLEILEETYVLPAEVTYFDPTPAPLLVTCPHCGQKLEVIVK